METPNYISLLQESVQKKLETGNIGSIIHYEIEEMYNNGFSAKVYICNKKQGFGVGKSKKTAKQNAAKCCLENIKEDFMDPLMVELLFQAATMYKVLVCEVSQNGNKLKFTANNGKSTHFYFDINLSQYNLFDQNYLKNCVGQLTPNDIALKFK